MLPRTGRRVGGILTVVSCFLVACLGSTTGCREKPTDKPPAPAASDSADAGRVPPPAPATPESGIARAEGADDKDDPRAPACLPKSYDVGQWFKHEPVRVTDPSGLIQVMTANEAERFGHFRVDLAARCAYAMKGSDGSTAQTQVLLVEAQSPEDAYGLMTCQSASRETADVGGETRVDRGEALHFHCWQGRSYVHVWTEPPAVASAEEVLPLLRHIVGRIPREDRPELLEAIPRDQKDTGQRWLVRSLLSLSPDAFDLARPPDLKKVNELLDLGNVAFMCIAAYEMPQARQPNVVWLVRYLSKDDAEAAYARYSAFISQAAGPATESTNLLRPHGPFLIGTWTAEEESLQYMMPRIKQLLPSQ
ncbi:MAG: hypothetical protein JXQ75_10615 [Phycisphaerae bacterium]|nr:hypothetical protein [Phycisphaerae bacterium]